MEVFHKGERFVQKKLGETSQAQLNSRIISDEIMPGAIPFITQQPMIILNSLDLESRNWVSVLLGRVGLLDVRSGNVLTINKENIQNDQKDIFFENIKRNKQVGALIIDLSTRKRFRVNGVIDEDSECIHLEVEEAYPNCPKYIQHRDLTILEPARVSEAIHNSGTALNEFLKNWIQKSDTFFVGSQSAAGKLDVSHRGGFPGFVEILDDQTLKIPDYKGNSMYNTLGNFIENQNAGLLFIDFSKGAILQLTGTAVINFDQVEEEKLRSISETGRYWLFRIHEWRVTVNYFNADSAFISYSPLNPILS